MIICDDCLHNNELHKGKRYNMQGVLQSNSACTVNRCRCFGFTHVGKTLGGESLQMLRAEVIENAGAKDR